MLINIDPILSPQILHTLRSMGHGDQIVLCDINFPAHSSHSNVIRLDGVDMARAMKAILSVFPLDSFAYFDTGFRILLGEYPFKDYWIIHGPFIDYFQSFFFYIFFFHSIK